MRRKSNSRFIPTIFYGWWVVIATSLAMAFIAASMWQAAGAFFVALQREFGWNRTLLSGAFAMTRAEGAVMGPVEGILSDKLGGRRTMLIGFVICVSGFLLLSTVQNPVSFYVAYVIMSTGAGLAGYIPIVTIINFWFNRLRTIAISGPLLGSSLGGTLVPLLAWGIDTHGWRWVAAGCGLFLAFIAGPIVMVVRDRPEPYGLNPDGDSLDAGEIPETLTKVNTSTSNREALTSGFTAREAIMTRAFWLISVAHAGTAVLYTTIAIHLVPHLTDQGMSLPKAGVVVLVLAATTGAFQLIGGWLGDRLDKRYVVAIFMMVQAVGMLFLLRVDSFLSGIVFGFISGIGQGGRAPAMTSIRGEYFGRRSFGAIMGLSMIPMNIGMIVVPLLTGIIYDRLGSYDLPFIFLAVLALAGGGLMLIVRRPMLRRVV
ncbi:MFS transporter [SAR202 cluster bacterium AD-804-J14_MRT_500m]|nr:MFS transporter [SAR202 cluster bacterium AD-804-J14_MRT_500m]